MNKLSLMTQDETKTQNNHVLPEEWRKSLNFFLNFSDVGATCTPKENTAH